MRWNFDRVIETEDGSLTLCHPDYDEEFHSRKGARYESRTLYMEASGFVDYLRDSGHTQNLAVLDVGLGLGYNALMTIDNWWHSPGYAELELISLELSRELVEALSQAQSTWKQGWSDLWRSWSESLQEGDDGTWSTKLVHPVSSKPLQWRIAVGDARQVELPVRHLLFIWQDAFSPKKNPELWTAEWFQKLRVASRQEVCLVSYSVARVVKDALVAAGWQFQRFQMGAQAKQWLKASLSSVPAEESLGEKSTGNQIDS